MISYKKKWTFGVDFGINRRQKNNITGQ